MSTNVLAFSVGPMNPPEEMALAAAPVIDGRPLTDRIAEFEIERHFESPGGYGGIVFELFDSGPVDEYFRKTGSIYVLWCECGEEGCWPLKCRVKTDRSGITWHDFLHPLRPERDYSALGPFTFDPVQYSQAIASLQTKLSKVR